MKNRSVPTHIVLPHIVYRNVAQAIAWLWEAFGFAEHYRYGEAEGMPSFLSFAMRLLAAEVRIAASEAI
jgi:uncharacterized glyoxalase superfamily protein PhnB